MKIFRTWPDVIPEGRTGYVVDEIPHYDLHMYDMRKIVELKEDILCIEWDLAFDKDEFLTFIDHAKEQPERVIVAPYRHYPEITGRPTAIWAHRRLDENGQVIFIEEGEPTCHLFGFGMTYLPYKLLRGFCDDFLVRNPLAELDDYLFSQWHYEHADDREVPITWDVRPVHLHFSTRGICDG